MPTKLAPFAKEILFLFLRYSKDLEEKANWQAEFDESRLRSTIKLNLANFSCGVGHCLVNHKNVTEGMILYLHDMSEPVTISD